MEDKTEIVHDTLVNDDDEATKAHKNEEPFLEPVRLPTNIEKRNMLGKSIEIMIIATLENHIYKFGDEIRRQKEGGPIGLSITGEIADCYMLNWDKEFLKKMKSLNMNPALYERFKDDITIVLRALEAGTKFEDGVLTVDMKKKVADEQKTDEEITMEVVRGVADSIDEMIKFTVDYPGNHKSGKMPVLDVEVAINKEKENKIEFQFYEKPTKNKKVILNDSAIPSKQKRTILTQECLRRLRNTQIDLGKEVQTKHLNEFMVKMKNSGYTAQYRKQILDSAYKAFEKMVKADQNGEKPLYRDKTWKKEIRKEQKENNRLNWYKNGKNGKKELDAKKSIDYKTVLFVPVTKGGLLAKELKKREEEINRYSNSRIKIIEDGGVQLKNFLIEKDPFPKTKCEKKKCFICNSEESDQMKFSCNSNNVGYRLECDTCIEKGKLRVYEGESSRSARVRGAEHLADLNHKRSKSVLLKHKIAEHQNEEMKIKMKITGKFRDPLTRQANEAVRISQRSKNTGELLNSKSEFNHPPLGRVAVEKRRYGQNN